MKEELPGYAKHKIVSKYGTETNGFRNRAKESANSAKPKTLMPSKSVTVTKETKLKRFHGEGKDLTRKGDLSSTRGATRIPAAGKKISMQNSSDPVVSEQHEDVALVHRKTSTTWDISKHKNGERPPRGNNPQKPHSSWCSEYNGRCRAPSSVENEVQHLRRVVGLLKENETRLRKDLTNEKREVDTAMLKIADLERELKDKYAEVEKLNTTTESLKTENTVIKEQASQTIRTLETKLFELQRSAQRETGVREKLMQTELQDKEVYLSAHSANPYGFTEKGVMSNKSAEKPEKNGKKQSRIPKPLPEPSATKTNSLSKVPLFTPPPPPPPPPPPFSTCALPRTVKKQVVQKSPQVIELYQSLMKKDAKKDPSCTEVMTDNPSLSNHSSMIGEIENRSAHLLAIKEDIKTKGNLVRSLIEDIQSASFSDIEDVLSFIQWLDEKLAVLVDERAVLKHFDWPEKKADTLREAALSYRDLKKLETEILSLEDLQHPCETSLKKMTVLLDKLERSTHDLVIRREQEMRLYKEYHVPTNWMLDSGMIKKLKISSVKLAQKYMKRISTELVVNGNPEKEVAHKALVLQGVRFAFRVHQFAGGFDEETMRAFEELKSLASNHNEEQQSLQPSVSSFSNIAKQTPISLVLGNKISNKSSLFANSHIVL